MQDLFSVSQELLGRQLPLQAKRFYDKSRGRSSFHAHCCCLHKVNHSFVHEFVKDHMKRMTDFVDVSGNISRHLLAEEIDSNHAYEILRSNWGPLASGV